MSMLRISIIYKPLLVVVAVLLQGCLQTELGGPVVGASVSIVELRSGKVVQSGLLTETTEQARSRFGVEQWLGFSPRLRMLFSGTLEVGKWKINDNSYYLVTARGGQDLDNSGTGEPTSSPRAVVGSWHAIMTGAQLRAPLVRVNVMTEAIYQSLAGDIENLSDSELGAKLDELAARVLGDVNADGKRNYNDALIWSNLTVDRPYQGDSLFRERMITAITEGYEAEVIAVSGIDVVDYVHWHVARPQGPYADDLIPCATPVLYRDLCSFARLPLLSMDGASPTVEAIMQRVIVSHDWMAERFETMLHELPHDILQLMGGLTTIAIGADIRPAYYWGLTAGIYLDAVYFWVDADEYETISKEEDYRAEYGRKLRFTDLSRYVYNGQRAFSYAEDGSGSRNPADVTKIAANLLFHELAHANDYFPSSARGSLSLHYTPYNVVSSRQALSDELQTLMPLTEERLVALGQVSFQGVEPSEEQTQIGAWAVGQMFNPDGAADLYAYSSSAEDMAMLFQETMMRIHYGFEREIAFANSPDDLENAECEEFIIAWGVRGRIGAPHVKRRALWVVNQIMPDSGYSDLVQAFPDQTAMQTGVDWCAHLPPLADDFRPGPLRDSRVYVPFRERGAQF